MSASDLPNRMGKHARKTWWFVAPALILFGTATIGMLGPAPIRRAVTLMLIHVVLVVGLYVFVGNSGILSFGHAGFMALGAYGSALLTVPVARKRVLLPELPGWLSGIELHVLAGMVVASIAAGILAAVTGMALMRLSGLGAAIATAAFLFIVYIVIRESDGITRGTSTFVGMPRSTTLPVALGGALVAVLLAAWFQNSGIGRRLRASREDYVASQAIGIHILWVRIVAFSLSGAIVGLGGALYGHYVGAFSPETFFIRITFVMFVMLVVGGMTSLGGAVIGAVVVSAGAELLRRLEGGLALGPITLPERPGVQEVALSLLVLAVLIWRPSGLLRGAEIRWPFSEEGGVRPYGRQS